MKFILSIGLLVIAILTLSFADEHEHEHSQHDGNSEFLEFNKSDNFFFCKKNSLIYSINFYLLN